jgi:hypothetical protein
VSSQCRNRTTTRCITRLIQICSDLDSFTLLIYLNLDPHVSKDALEPLYKAFIMPSVLLHAKQEAVQDRIVAGLQTLFCKDLLVRLEERTGGGRSWLGRMR